MTTAGGPAGVDTSGLWQIVVTAIAAPFLLYWVTDGVMARIRARRAREAEVSEDRTAARREHVENLEAALARETARADREAERADAERERADREKRSRRVFEDYCYTLRGAWIIAECTGAPPPWPDV